MNIQRESGFVVIVQLQTFKDYGRIRNTPELTQINKLTPYFQKICNSSNSFRIQIQEKRKTLLH